VILALLTGTRCAHPTGVHATAAGAGNASCYLQHRRRRRPLANNGVMETTRTTGGLTGLATIAALTGLVACERVNRTDDDAAAPMLTLRVETPEALDWGSSGSLRLTLANEGDVPAEGGIVEVHVPDWLEFGTVEPAGTEVTVVSGDEETRLTYRLTDTIPAGDSRIVIQHLRVVYAPRPQAPIADSIETIQLAPTNQLVRARLLTADGEPLGAEVQATLHFVGFAGPLPPRDTVRDTLRDTTIVPVDTASRPPPADTTSH
jgi:hypothetical protein